MKRTVVVAIMAIMFLIGGCAATPPDEETVPNIGGLHLGDTQSQVTQVLGSEYEETFSEEGGHFGESYYIWDYQDGIELIIGKESGKVLQIDVTTPEMKTNMGVKVGDKVATAIETYQEKYSEPESIHTGEKVEGWFEVEDGALVIFDVDKDDDTIVNPDMTQDDEVEMIRLVYSKYID
ncbi:MAG: hypothetical protein ACOX4Q_07300 [Syntrophomonadales bacterium]